MSKSTRYRGIEITQEHINLAIPKSSSHCMISDAVKDRMPAAKRISTDLATIRYTLGDVRYVHLTPQSAQVALLKFDKGEPIEPFVMNLQAPVQTVEARRRAKRTDMKSTVKD